MDDKFERYVTELFAAEDPILSKIRARHAAENLPTINVSPEEGKLLHLLLLTIGATNVLEIGSLGGYSGVWLARALPPTGKLITIEKDPRHARIAREAFASAGLSHNPPSTGLRAMYRTHPSRCASVSTTLAPYGPPLRCPFRP